MPFPQGIKDWEPCEDCNEVTCFGECIECKYCNQYLFKCIKCDPINGIPLTSKYFKHVN